MFHDQDLLTGLKIHVAPVNLDLVCHRFRDYRRDQYTDTGLTCKRKVPGLNLRQMRLEVRILERYH